MTQSSKKIRTLKLIAFFSVENMSRPVTTCSGSSGLYHSTLQLASYQQLDSLAFIFMISWQHNTSHDQPDKHWAPVMFIQVCVLMPGGDCKGEKCSPPVSTFNMFDPLQLGIPNTSVWRQISDFMSGVSCLRPPSHSDHNIHKTSLWRFSQWAMTTINADMWRPFRLNLSTYVCSPVTVLELDLPQVEDRIREDLCKGWVSSCRKAVIHSLLNTCPHCNSLGSVNRSSGTFPEVKVHRWAVHGAPSAAARGAARRGGRRRLAVTDTGFRLWLCVVCHRVVYLLGSDVPGVGSSPGADGREALSSSQRLRSTLSANSPLPANQRQVARTHTPHYRPRVSK